MKDGYMKLDLEAVDPLEFPSLEVFVGALAYLDEMRDGLPHLYERSISHLEAQSGSWEEFCGDSFEVDVVYKFHMPRALYYSFIIYLHSLIECKLDEVTKTVMKIKLIPIKSNDINGSVIERTQKYISKLGGIEIACIQGWAELRDLHVIRNVLVHRGGKPSADHKSRSEIKAISKRAKNLVTLTPSWDDEDSEINFGYEYCSDIAKIAYGFFKKLIEKCKLGIAHKEPSNPEA